VSQTALASRALELRRAFDQTFAVAADARTHESVDLIDIALLGQPYAIRTDEIAGIQFDLIVSPIPGPLPELAGITALRGALLPVYDLGLVFGVGSAAGRWIVLDATRTVGLSFSEFHGHARIDAAALAKSDGEGGAASHVARLGGGARPVISIPFLVESIRQRAERADARRG
jgi:chemotaxis signal transduction protein